MSHRRQLILLFSLLLAGAIAYPAAADVPLITKEELKPLVDDPNIIILDVRRGKDWSSSEFKIKGAVHADPNDYKNWAGVYPKEKKIVLYCA
jgi:rhodanese-related sulfurtransferase